MNGSNPTDDVLRYVDEAALIGITSVEITKKSGIPNNRVTASLVNLLYEGSVRREKDEHAGAYRYWYKHARPAAGSGARCGGNTRRQKRPREKSDDDVMLVLPLGRGEAITTTLEGARALFKHLYVLFGSKS